MYSLIVNIGSFSKEKSQMLGANLAKLVSMGPNWDVMDIICLKQCSCTMQKDKKSKEKKSKEVEKGPYMIKLLNFYLEKMLKQSMEIQVGKRGQLR